MADSQASCSSESFFFPTFLGTEARFSVLAPWTSPLMNIRTVRAIDPATQTAAELVNILKVVGSWLTSVPYYDLPVFVYETDCGRSLFHGRFIPCQQMAGENRGAFPQNLKTSNATSGVT